MSWLRHSYGRAAVGLMGLWLVASPGAGSSRDKDWRPVQVTMALSPGATAGTAVVAINLRIEKTWYVYVRSSSSTVLQVDLELPPGVRVDGDWQRPPPRVVYQDEKVEIYVGDQVLTRPLRIDPAFKGELVVNARVRYQACDPSVCMPAEEVVVSARLEKK